MYSDNNKKKGIMNITSLVAHTDARLTNWYANAKRDYGVIGSGFSKFNKETEELEIYYTEEGVDCLFKHYVHQDFNLGTIFEVWATKADLEKDKIN